jgi:hypothetical protein
MALTIQLDAIQIAFRLCGKSRQSDSIAACAALESDMTHIPGFKRSQLLFLPEAMRKSRVTKRTSPVAPDSCIRHCRLRIMRMISKPFIVADADGIRAFTAKQGYFR